MGRCSVRTGVCRLSDCACVSIVPCQRCTWGTTHGVLVFGWPLALLFRTTILPHHQTGRPALSVGHQSCCTEQAAHRELEARGWQTRRVGRTVGLRKNTRSRQLSVPETERCCVTVRKPRVGDMTRRWGGRNVRGRRLDKGEASIILGSAGIPTVSSAHGEGLSVKPIGHASPRTLLAAMFALPLLTHDGEEASKTRARAVPVKPCHSPTTYVRRHHPWGTGLAQARRRVAGMLAERIRGTAFAQSPQTAACLALGPWHARWPWP